MMDFKKTSVFQPCSKHFKERKTFALFWIQNCNSYFLSVQKHWPPLTFLFWDPLWHTFTWHLSDSSSLKFDVQRLGLQTIETFYKSTLTKFGWDCSPKYVHTYVGTSFDLLSQNPFGFWHWSAFSYGRNWLNIAISALSKSKLPICYEQLWSLNLVYLR